MQLTNPGLYAISSTTYERAAATELDRRKDIIGRFLFLALSVLFFAVPRPKKLLSSWAPTFLGGGGGTPRAQNGHGEGEGMD